MFIFFQHFSLIIVLFCGRGPIVICMYIYMYIINKTNRINWVFRHLGPQSPKIIYKNNKIYEVCITNYLTILELVLL